MTNLTLQTKPVKQKDIKRAWHLIDAKKKIVGRLASEVAKLLIGKHKVDYVEYLDIGDNVVVINASKIELSGKKELTKTYSRYSGYPGGLKRVSFKELKDKRPEEIVRHAVYGMLPKNKLRARRIIRLFTFRDNKHPFEDKFKLQNTKSK
ncbi:50S ribosomal protein L13 [Candidatus Roizmanbacteria bacterium RIFCSPHIGHO2_02_FULL_37_13b]|uniref:Large ribosomal subunit protein uL13 n=1 Tax=Candidatus Roizmanbacteria bacterium RIFCSPLOWO2_02_FULL_36_11 TaxID=1802071 RepID=A0A1F7JCJ3_9BACT|nr:MAG: 50S ribosomal protein L13 [Candidatus Roizmanbacteria bacterium RIFCSPHIGHO2_02_FULL_37_13b]OGK53307.1 MAG: 50S ribosomal protein L13 [Candidatus Roizmanbacteria bacterium RIFCSPLOWO2_02_FULL_36_11]